MEILAPHVAKNALAGQFVILKINKNGERIPLTIAGTKPNNGLVKIVFQEIGKTTTLLGSLKEGEFIEDFLGPLGKPTKIQKYGKVVAVAGGLGIAEIIPVISEFKKKKNFITTIIGAKSKEFIILKSELLKNSDSIFFTTNDGSYGIKGSVIDVLKKNIDINEIDVVYTVGPILMMKAVSDLTLKQNIKTIVSLNPIMIDGTGMCGSCRININNKIKFACIDGPEFDANSINWLEVISRLDTFKSQEKVSFDIIKKECKCQKNQKYKKEILE
jgi:ferredoxin--NADP+ reductase